MNIARTFFNFRYQNVPSTFYRNLRRSTINYDSSQASQPQVKEETFDFEDLKVLERVERRKPKIEPFMKNVFNSIFDRDLLAYCEILNKEESEELDRRVSTLNSVFSDSNKTKEDRKDALKRTSMYAAPVNLTNGGLAANITESIRYLETISSDLQLGQELSDHWVALLALKSGLSPEQFQQIVDDLTSGDKSISLCIKEKVSDRILKQDFRTTAELDGQGVWRVTGEKMCLRSDGYFLVLATLEANRLKAFLIHPGVEGISYDDKFVNFLRSPATPLEHISEPNLAQTLGISRLFAATLARCHLTSAMKFCTEYIRPRFLGGKPLSEISAISATIGEALLDIYASESAEYFTAGLMDGYMEPDAELEMAMCRNFMADHGITNLLKMLSIPALEKLEECNEMLYTMRHLTLRGETIDGVNAFIALNGIHHAGKMMVDEVKKIRNPLMHPAFIMKKIFADRHQEKDDPKLTLFLIEHLHPTLKPPADQLEYCVLRMRYACETMMSRHGMNVATAFTELNRLAEAATEILVMTSVLARASRSYCIGIRNAELEMKLAACFVENTKAKVKKLILDIDNGEYLNLDHFKVSFGKRILEPNVTEPCLVEKPTTRVWW